MAESAAFARRGTSGAALRTTLASGITNAQTSIDGVDLSTWTGTITNGPARATISDGTTEEEIEFTGVSSNTLTGVTRGVGGTSAAAWSAGATLTHGLSVRDVDEANKLVNAILGISGLAAGDLLYLTAATTFARLAKGTARQQLAMNAAANAPEWVASLQSLLTATGDIVYASGANTPARLAAGSNGYVLTLAGGVPTWAAATSSIPANDSAVVATSESTTSDTFTDLATAGPAVTVTTGTKALVTITGLVASNDAGYMSYTISGASTRVADTNRVFTANTASGEGCFTYIEKGLTAGSNTFTTKYRRANTGTATFSNRRISVIDMGS